MVLLLRIGPFQPTRDLFRRPVCAQLARHPSAECRFACQFTGLWTMRSIPGRLVSPAGPVMQQATVTVHFPADSRGCASQPTGNCPQRQITDRPREISSRSASVSARRERCRGGGRMPPLGASMLKTDEEGRSNNRPIELCDSPRRQRSQISALCAAVYLIRVR